jgi:hypothetical protein
MCLRIAFHRGTTFQSGDDAHALRKLSRYGKGVPGGAGPQCSEECASHVAQPRPILRGKALSFFALNHPKGSFSPLREELLVLRWEIRGHTENIVKKRKNVLTRSCHFG